jgi:aryl-alcohol dehydrogenase-like predicted oxidoreductase
MIATQKGVMPCQLALAGAERQLELEENLSAQDLKLTSNDLAELNAVIPSAAAWGNRYQTDQSDRLR